MIPAPARFEAGYEGWTLAFAGEVLELVMPRAFAPGAPLHFVVAAPTGESLTLNGRTIGSKRRPDGSFHVRLRLTNLRREERLCLERLRDEVPA